MRIDIAQSGRVVFGVWSIGLLMCLVIGVGGCEMERDPSLTDPDEGVEQHDDSPTL